MELNPRQAAFVVSEMEKVENSDTRLSSEQVEARRIRREAEATLTE
jgi:hypothetical protein